jgi:hypothetical protein
LAHRSKITLAVAGDGARIGFHRYDEPATVFDLEDCPLAMEPLMVLLHGLRAARARLPRGTAQVVLRLDREGGRHVVVLGGDAPWDARAFAAALPDPAPAVWWQPADGAVRAVAGTTRVSRPRLPAGEPGPRGPHPTGRRGLAGRAAWRGGLGPLRRRGRQRPAARRDRRNRLEVDADRSAIAWAERQPVPTGTLPAYLAGRVEEVLHRLRTGPW